MIMSISSQNTTFVILTIVIILIILMLIMMKKEYKRFLIFFDFDSQALKDLITFINHIFCRNKFKRFKYYSPFFIN